MPEGTEPGAQKDGGGAGEGGSTDDPNKKPDPKGQSTAPGGQNDDPGGDDPNQNDPEGSENWDEKTKNYIKSLRSENAKYRTQAKKNEQRLTDLGKKFDGLQGGLKKALGLGDDSTETPEEKAKSLQSHVDSLEFELGVRDVALEHGLGDKKSVKYMKFLMQERMADLEEGDEISEDDLNDIVKQVKETVGGQSGTSTTNTSKTSPTGSTGGDKTPSNNTNGAMSAEQFSKMTLGEKTALFQKNRAAYDKLMAEAREKRLIR